MFRAAAFLPTSAKHCNIFKQPQTRIQLPATNWGNMYKDGLCIARDLNAARQWLEKSAQAGSKDAAQNLKNLRLEPDNAAQSEINRAIEMMNRSDWTNALPILISLANRGIAVAQDQLGWSYLYGQGSKGNPAQAFNWFKKAAEQGDSFAQALLGICYELGEGVPVDEQAASSWYQRSADQKSGTGEIYLARAYEFGIGTRQDLKQARQTASLTQRLLAPAR
jgi:TPR repeat protein